MNLTRLYAYEVFPQKNEANREQPKGGSIRVDSQLKKTLGSLIRENRLESETPIAFHVPDGPGRSTRFNATRTALLTFAFGKGPSVTSQADHLAFKLSSAMDDRSKPFLLLLSAFAGESVSRVVIWAFPKDQGFKFAVTPRGAEVQVVEDIFNVSAALKKAALFEGTDSGDSFWQGRMIDIQSGRTSLWVEQFLECRLAMSGDFGTTILAEYVAKAYRSVTTTDAREQLFGAIVAVRTAPVRRMSCERFANSYLKEEASDVFLAAIPAQQRDAAFDFDRQVFEEKLGFREFKMEDDVRVTAPLAAINRSVRLDDGRLRYEGIIRDEYMRAGRGRQ